jgi:hypothetical protein
MSKKDETKPTVFHDAPATTAEAQAADGQTIIAQHEFVSGFGRLLVVLQHYRGVINFFYETSDGKHRQPLEPAAVHAIVEIEALATR